MLDETVQAEWVGEHTFVLRDHLGFPIIMAQPGGANGADLLPLSLIGCAAWEIVTIVRKQRQSLTGFRVTATSERDERPPRRFRRIRIRYTFTGHDLRADRIRRAIELTEAKYCGVYATLQPAVEIVSEFEIRNDDAHRP